MPSLCEKRWFTFNLSVHCPGSFNTAPPASSRAELSPRWFWSRGMQTCLTIIQVSTFVLVVHTDVHNYKSLPLCTFKAAHFWSGFKTFWPVIYTVWLILEQIIANLSVWSCRHLKSKTYLVSITYVRMSLSLRRNIIETWTNQGWRVEETSIVCWTKSWNVGGIHICPIIHLIIVMS